MMREQPWNIRRATAEHDQWYRNILDLHALTLGWLKELESEQPSHFLKRGAATPELAEALSMLERITESAPKAGAGFDTLLDDSEPTDLLTRLEHTVHAVQALTLSHLLERAQADDRTALLNQLEQNSWKAGRLCGETRWSTLSREARGDLRAALSALRDSPMSGLPHHDNLLVKRVIAEELQLELLGCPHQSRHNEVRSTADALCSLHTHWIRGFAYAINTRLSIEHWPATSQRRCQLIWSLLPEA